jgi:oligopeptide transport system substrate-binding protein
VRLALSMTVDRRIMAEKVLGTGEKPAWRFTPDVTAVHTAAFAIRTDESGRA